VLWVVDLPCVSPLAMSQLGGGNHRPAIVLSLNVLRQRYLLVLEWPTLHFCQESVVKILRRNVNDLLPPKATR
jgi:hypothetical protein